MMKETIQQRISASIAVKEQVLQSSLLLETIEKCIVEIVQCFEHKHKLWFCGNGGSAADAQHLAAEFSGRFFKERKALPAEAMHVNTSYITAVANDYSYDDIYSRLVDGVVEKGDVLIGLSTSGNSKNILNAFSAAQKKGICTIGFTGITGGEMKPYCNHLINVPSSETPRIQEAHMLIGHIICEMVEAKIFGN